MSEYRLSCGHFWVPPKDMNTFEIGDSAKCPLCNIEVTVEEVVEQ